MPAGSFHEGVFNGAAKPLGTCVVSGGPQRRPAGVELPSCSGMSPASSMGKPGAGCASTVLLLLRLCDPVLVVEGMDTAKGGACTFILYFQQIVPWKSPDEDCFPWLPNYQHSHLTDMETM